MSKYRYSNTVNKKPESWVRMHVKMWILKCWWNHIATSLLTSKDEMLRTDAIAETMSDNLIWTRACSTSSWCIAVVQRVFSTSLSLILVTLLRNRISQMTWYRSLAGPIIFPGVKTLHHARYTSNSSIHLSPNFRTKVSHGIVTREQPLLPPSCTLWNRLFVSYNMHE